MPSEFNHLDDFFRNKEEASAADLSRQDLHWKQMKELLATPPSTAARWRSSTLYWMAAAIAIVLLLTASLLLRTEKQTTTRTTATEEKKPAQVAVPDPMHPANISSSKNRNTGTPSAGTSKSRRLPAMLTDTFDIFLSGRNKGKVISDVQVFLPKEGDQKVLPDNQHHFNQFFRQLKKPAQEFIVQAKKDTTLLCAEGTSIHIPAHAFQTALGVTITSQVTISVHEFYSLADIIGNKLSTTSNGQALVTAGMVHIGARAGKEAVQVRPGLALGLTIPASHGPQLYATVLHCG